MTTSAASRSGGAAMPGCSLKPDYQDCCGAPAPYKVYDDTCHICVKIGGDRVEPCFGHPVCEQHAADLRAKAVPSHKGDDTRPFTVSRIHSLETTASDAP